MGEIAEMIDLHSHILCDLDDGAEVLEESIEMCRISYHDGIRTIVATPHILEGIYENDRSTILTRLQELNEALKKFEVKNLDPMTQLPNDSITELEILPGADVHFSSDMLQRYEEGEIVTVNDQGRYLMVEFEFQGIPYKAEEALFQLLMKGIVPIISHPERNMEIGKKPKRYYEMIRMGCLGQVTAMSLTGEFGTGVKKVAEKLLAHRLIHFIASDAHSINRRPPLLSSGVKAAEKIVGKEEAQKMVTEYPQAIIEGRRPNVPDPIEL
jgi:protein-tyrosine phosphatase